MDHNITASIRIRFDNRGTSGSQYFESHQAPFNLASITNEPGGRMSIVVIVVILASPRVGRAVLVPHTPDNVGTTQSLMRPFPRACRLGLFVIRVLLICLATFSHHRLNGHVDPVLAQPGRIHRFNIFTRKRLDRDATVWNHRALHNQGPLQDQGRRGGKSPGFDQCIHSIEIRLRLSGGEFSKHALAQHMSFMEDIGPHIRLKIWSAKSLIAIGNWQPGFGNAD
ncbi:hypothetical protein DFP72DRAFT_862825 [Ephemerocybe angulata]|uniref:Uncharacterized protein n=1 Tax=Ephemerocybe angulata TaxID=980116 RepID=A0A8H6H691_9AGAR|nr:hypothetical protein DFP72DRAFT_862825 [Tulosesus angulatus]